MGIHVEQLRLYVVRPVLNHLELWSRAAENLVVGTALVESDGVYLKQIKGPALGLWQMEPATHDDIWRNYLRYKPELADKVKELCTPSDVTAGALELIGNLYYGAAMCRIHYLRVPQRLPNADDAEGMARYWKQHYNTPAGAGTVWKALPFFKIACD